MEFRLDRVITLLCRFRRRDLQPGMDGISLQRVPDHTLRVVEEAANVKYIVTAQTKSCNGLQKT
jgi:hypothetical protein